MDKTPAPLFRRQNAIPSSVLPSSSPAFGTPVHPLKPFNVTVTKAAILPIILPPATLRPLAFRTFTKKHSLTLTSSAPQELAAFIGRHCGSGWREEGLAERVLEEAARSWKNRNGGVIVDGSSKQLHDILKTLEGNMSGGKIVGPGRSLPRGDSMLDVRDGDEANTRLGLRPTTLSREDSNASFGISDLGVQEEADEDEDVRDPRAWLKVIDAHEQPRLVFNIGKKHFERETAKPSLFPPASHKTTVFRNRYHVIPQRLLRNEAFQTSTVSSSRLRSPQRSLSNQKSLKITQIANMLGRDQPHAARSAGRLADWRPRHQRLDGDHCLGPQAGGRHSRGFGVVLPRHGGLGGRRGEEEEGEAAAGEAVAAAHLSPPDPMDLDAAASHDEPAASPPAPLAEDVRTAQKLVKTLLDQGFLAPFRQAARPVHWDHASALHLYPLPSAMVLVDTTAPPFCLSYEGCHVMNPAAVLVPGKRGVARWVEYEVGRLGRLRECTF
ncbi:DNA polymerase alpha/epsilon, subunit B [Ophiocordyceps sinensis CO18]|uniref:DNA polymerase epsilon subunit B n=1 Tax=Ophiocordyceps sinensis (strain Co18 / CGMCC 3.14243) TaxID=911162 RepID=T5APE4_OPHSC|nr:DNA polymerase alpha/epsilon, subunit B [Ophiocordyceps sinensis CO18]